MADQEEGSNGSKVGVAYTVKELLSNLNDKIDRIEGKLDRKLDKTEYDYAHDALVSKVNLLETKLATAEALKKQQDEIGQIYLRQWEAMQKDIIDLKGSKQAADAVAKDKDNWKILWYPMIVSLVCNAVLLYVAVGGKI
jgi:hypothetical protein